MADLTYIWAAEGWLYVAAGIGLFCRRVVRQLLSDAMTAQLVIDALTMAIWRWGKPDAGCIIRTKTANIPMSSSSG